VVSAPMSKRLTWVMQRDGVDETEVQRRMANQIPLEEKVKRADYVIENSGDLVALDASVNKLIDWLKARASA
jgi:dephospho-CoA kinase